MSSGEVQHTLYAQFAEIAKALSHQHRLELLELIAQGETSVETLAGRAGLSIANTSQHLQCLRRAGFVTARRQAKFVLYRLADDAVLDLLAAMQRLAARRSGDVNHILTSYFRERDELEAITRQELVARMEEGLVTVLDVRPADEYALGHVPGARNIPVSQLPEKGLRLDPNAEIVAYCRGPYCVMAFEAVAELRRLGYKVRRLEGGFPQWRAAGLPVESDPAA